MLFDITNRPRHVILGMEAQYIERQILNSVSLDSLAGYFSCLPWRNCGRLINENVY